MRFSYFVTLALSGLAIASPVAVVQKRADAVAMLNDLFSQIQVYTGAISMISLSLLLIPSLLNQY
jgi:hypothetical protein